MNSLNLSEADKAVARGKTFFFAKLSLVNLRREDPAVQAWNGFAQKATPRRAVNAAGASTWLNWTQYPDHGPDETILGPVDGKRVVELGAGTGANLVHLATLSATASASTSHPPARPKRDQGVRPEGEAHASPGRLITQTGTEPLA